MFMDAPGCVAVVLGFDAGAFASCAKGMPAANKNAVPTAIASDFFMVTLQVKRLNEDDVLRECANPEDQRPRNLGARQPSVRRALSRYGGLQVEADGAKGARHTLWWMCVPR